MTSCRTISRRTPSPPYWGFPAEGLRRLGRAIGLHDVEIVDEVIVGGHPRIVALMRAAT